MASLLYQLWVSAGLVTLGIYNLISSTRSFLKSPHSYSAKPFHPLSSFSPYLNNSPLYLLILSLFISFLHQTLISSLSDPLLKGATPVHRFTSLHSALLLLLFLLLSAAPLFSSLPNDLLFAFASSFFFLQYSFASSSSLFQTSDLQFKCDDVFAGISAFSSLMCLILAVNPRLFAADVSLAASIVLQGFWALQTGLSLSVEAFIPEGCHKLLDVVSGVDGSTKCDLEESRLRALAILDLLFAGYVIFVVVIVMVCYGVVAKSVGIRRAGSYEALPTSSGTDSNHIQMKALTGTQA